jgi:uncharacterized protein YbjT (DUF2867 family)
MTVLVTGATGTLGRATTPALVAAGHEVRALSRSVREEPGPAAWVRADLATGEGLAEAVAGIDTVVHLASAPYQRDYTRQVDVEGTRRLLRLARDAGVRHLLYVSIVGIDQIPWGYFRTKLAAERLVEESELGWSILRATQFHDLYDTALSAVARLGVIPYDRGIHAQPVDPADVARRLVDLVAIGPSGGTTEFGGPQVLSLDDITRQWVDLTPRPRRRLRVRVPGRLGAAFRAGHLTTSATPRGGVTWRDHLEARKAGSRAPHPA